jgi:hypothetical protein
MQILRVARDERQTVIDDFVAHLHFVECRPKRIIVNNTINILIINQSIHQSINQQQQQ